MIPRSPTPPDDLSEPSCAPLAERLHALLARDPLVVWTPAGLVAASGAAPIAVTAALRVLLAGGRVHDTAPAGTEPRVRYAGAVTGPPDEERATDAPKAPSVPLYTRDNAAD